MIYPKARITNAGLDALRAFVEEQELAWESTRTDERFYDVCMLDAKAQLGHIRDLVALWPIRVWYRAFFLAIPPGGYVHRHRDGNDVYVTYHIPVFTNPDSVTYEHFEDGAMREHRMDVVGGVYYFERTREHSSANRGQSRRVHLIMEIQK